MTAVAPPPTFPNRWSGANGVNGATPMTTDDLRMFMPRKSAQRSNSTSSLSSQASTSSTVSNSSSLGPAPAVGDSATWAARKKAPRLWPATTKTEPVSGITNARPQSIASATSGTSATSAMTALHTPAPMVPSQHNGSVQTQQNGALRAQGQEAPAILHLIPLNGTFERKTITVPFFPDVLRIGRQTNNKTIPTPLNGYFDSKVLSRQHAEIWADRNGKIWIRDVKSSNGTFVNGQRLSPENRDSDPHELREQDMLELGIDIVSEDQKTIVHHKVAARVEHAGIYAGTGNAMMDLNFGEMEQPQMSNMVGSNGQQQLAQMRGRTPSQGSVNSQRLQGPGVMPNNAGMQQARHPNFWLQPITMEQVVKKLNAEFKAARQQSQDLQQTHSYINAILSADPKKEQVKSSPMNHKISPIKDFNLKARFSDPPAPPPQQPLPEKPDAQTSILRRSDTERPKANGSPVRSDPQMTSLNEALQNAKKEMESQSIRLRDLEALLTEERRAREDAEERANRLEREREAAESGLANGNVQKPEDVESEDTEAEIVVANGSVSPEHDAATLLQEKLDRMMSEMSEMKIQMEKYRERAESAEADRKTLAEMIENIRQDNAKKSTKETKRQSGEVIGEVAAKVDGETDGEEELEEGEITIINEDLEEEGARTLIRRAVQNGQPAESQAATNVTDKPSNVLATRSNRNEFALAHGAPAVSILTVVALGVAVMAWLNNYPKVDR